MSKYIDADRLRKEIEKNKNMIDGLFTEGDDSAYDGEDDAYNRVRRIINSLQREQNFAQDTELTYFESALFTAFSYAWQDYLRGEEVNVAQWAKENSAELLEAAKFQQEQQEVDLEKFTEKIKTFQGRYKHPEIVSIKGAMAFMARMFYQYPNVARQWYDNLPKVTMD